MSGPLDLLLLRIFQQQVADQRKVVLTGAKMVNDGLGVGSRARDPLWVGVQILITGAGNISKALWGQGGKFAEQRAKLRESLSVSDDSSLRAVSMRNHFEHYDERLDKWWRDSRDHHHLDRMVGQPSEVVGLDDRDRFRVYDNTTHDLIFWGQRFNVQAIATEADRILPIAEREAAKPHWDTK